MPTPVLRAPPRAAAGALRGDKVAGGAEELLVGRAGLRRRRHAPTCGRSGDHFPLTPIIVGGPEARHQPQPSRPGPTGKTPPAEVAGSSGSGRRRTSQVAVLELDNGASLDFMVAILGDCPVTAWTPSRSTRTAFEDPRADPQSVRRQWCRPDPFAQPAGGGHHDHGGRGRHGRAPDGHPRRAPAAVTPVAASSRLSCLARHPRGDLPPQVGGVVRAVAPVQYPASAWSRRPSPSGQGAAASTPVRCSARSGANCAVLVGGRRRPRPDVRRHAPGDVFRDEVMG